MSLRFLPCRMQQFTQLASARARAGVQLGVLRHAPIVCQKPARTQQLHSSLTTRALYGIPHLTGPSGFEAAAEELKGELLELLGGLAQAAGIGDDDEASAWNISSEVQGTLSRIDALFNQAELRLLQLQMPAWHCSSEHSDAAWREAAASCADELDALQQAMRAAAREAREALLTRAAEASGTPAGAAGGAAAVTAGAEGQGLETPAAGRGTSAGTRSNTGDRPPTALPRRQRQLLLKQLQARERALMAAGRTPGPVPLLVLCYDSEVKGDEGLEALCQPLPLLDSHQGTASAASVHQNTIRDSGNGSDVSDRARDGTEPASSTLTLGVLQQAVHRYDSALQASTGQRSASPGPVQQSRSQGRPSGPGAASATLFRDLAAQRLVSQSQGSQEFNGWSDSDDDDQEEYPSAVWTWAPVQGLVPVYASTTTATGQGGASLLGNQKPWGSDHKQQQQQQQQRVLAFLTPAAAQAIRRSVQDDPSPPAAQGSTSASPSSTGGPTSSTQAPPGAQPQPRLCVLSLDMGQAGGISVYHPDPRLRELMYQALVVQSVKHLLQVVDELSEVRAARARLEGWPSLADKKLSGTSAGHPLSMASFLVDLCQALSPAVVQGLASLEAQLEQEEEQQQQGKARSQREGAAQHEEGGGNIGSVGPADMLRALHVPHDPESEAVQLRRWHSTLGPLFALEPLLTGGLSRLLEPAGLVITLHPEAIQEDECWVVTSPTVTPRVQHHQQELESTPTAQQLPSSEVNKVAHDSPGQHKEQRNGSTAGCMLKLLVQDAWPRSGVPGSQGRGGSQVGGATHGPRVSGAPGKGGSPTGGATHGPSPGKGGGRTSSTQGITGGQGLVDVGIIYLVSDPGTAQPCTTLIRPGSPPDHDKGTCVLPIVAIHLPPQLLETCDLGGRPALRPTEPSALKLILHEMGHAIANALTAMPPAAGAHNQHATSDNSGGESTSQPPSQDQQDRKQHQKRDQQQHQKRGGNIFKTCIAFAPTELSELPSHTMERCATDPATLRILALHTGSSAVGGAPRSSSSTNTVPRSSSGRSSWHGSPLLSPADAAWVASAASGSGQGGEAVHVRRPLALLQHALLSLVDLEVHGKAHAEEIDPVAVAAGRTGGQNGDVLPSSSSNATQHEDGTAGPPGSSTNAGPGSNTEAALLRVWRTMSGLPAPLLTPPLLAQLPGLVINPAGMAAYPMHELISSAMWSHLGLSGAAPARVTRARPASTRGSDKEQGWGVIRTHVFEAGAQTPLDHILQALLGPESLRPVYAPTGQLLGVVPDLAATVYQDLEL